MLFTFNQQGYTVVIHHLLTCKKGEEFIVKSLTVIKQNICFKYEISSEQLVSVNKRRLLVLARLEFAKRAIMEGYSQTDIGEFLNQRTPSTISKLLSRKRQLKIPFDGEDKVLND